MQRDTVDRFWMVGKTAANTPSSPVAHLTFRFTNAAPVERSSGMIPGANPGRAQPWWNYLNNRAWIRLITPYTSTNYHTAMQYGVLGTYDSVRVQNYNWPTLPPQAASGGANPLYATTGGYIGDVNPWAISANSTPLPVELINFNAKAEGKHVRLNWSTASEINNDYFTIERAGKDNLDEFDFITKVNSQMNNSTVTLNYEAWDYNPLPGLQYYRLKQTDFDGQFSYSDIKPVYFGESKTFEISNVYGLMESQGEFKVEFVYDSEMPLDLVLTDMEGRVVYKQNGIAATPGVNTVNLNQQLPHGVYFVILQNTEKAVNRKFFY
jgi:hypothetical protein